MIRRSFTTVACARPAAIRLAMRCLAGAALLAAALPLWARAELLVGNKSADTVWRIDPSDGRKRGEFASGEGPHEIAVSPDRRLALVTNYGRERAGNTLSAIDLAAGSVRSIALGEHRRPHGVRFLRDGRRALVTTEDSGTLLLVDVERGRVERAIDVGDGVGHMVALSRDDKIAYVSKIAAGTVSRVDLAAGRKTLEAEAGAGAEGIDVAADGSVWVSNRADDTVTVHDPDTLAVRATLRSEGFPIRVAFTADGRHALVSNARAATLSVFDAETRARVATVDLAPEGVEFKQTLLGKAALPIGVVADPVAPRVYVAISGADRVAVVNTENWKVVDYWTTGREPDALGIVRAAIDD